MKLLIENLRKFLSERKTDVFYDKIADYFYDLLKNHEKYFYSWQGDLHDYYSLTIRNRTVTEEEFKRYQEMTGDDTVMPSYLDFYLAMIKFTVKATDQKVRPGDAADMSSQGTMRIFVNRSTTSIDAFVDKIPSQVFKHEIAHWLNDIRSGFKKYRSKGAGKDTNKSFDSKQISYYANSTEEIQARVTEVFDLLKTVMSKQVPENPRFPDDLIAKDFQDALRERDPELFIKHAIANYGYDYFYYHLLTEKNKKRLMKRFYEIYEYFLSNREQEK